MKIQHLLEYQFPEIQRVNINVKRHPGKSNYAARAEKRKSMKSIRGDVSYVGGGSYAEVWANNQRTPQDVRKISKTSKRHQIDGFYFFMMELEKHDENSNPYFPRFRSIKIYTDEGPKHRASKLDSMTYSTQIERLTHLSKLSEDQIKAIVRRIFGVSRLDSRAKDIIYNIMQLNKTWDLALLGLIEATRKGLMGTSPPSPPNKELQWFVKQIQDQDFVQALQFIIDVKIKHGLHFDLHDDNIMVRQSPYGGQLVFSDPLSGEGSNFSSEPDEFI